MEGAGTVENEFQFEQWEKTWDADEHGGSGVGKHVIFRVYIDYPSLPSGLPDWLRAAGVKETPYSDYGGGKSPDYNHPRMVAAMERLITESANATTQILAWPLFSLDCWVSGANGTRIHAPNCTHPKTPNGG